MLQSRESSVQVPMLPVLSSYLGSSHWLQLTLVPPLVWTSHCTSSTWCAFALWLVCIINIWNAYNVLMSVIFILILFFQSCGCVRECMYIDRQGNNCLMKASLSPWAHTQQLCPGVGRINSGSNNVWLISALTIRSFFFFSVFLCNINFGVGRLCYKGWMWKMEFDFNLEKPLSSSGDEEGVPSI